MVRTPRKNTGQGADVPKARRTSQEQDDLHTQSRRLNPARHHWGPASPGTTIFAAFIRALQKRDGGRQ
jgi:hypothetical protein